MHLNLVQKTLHTLCELWGISKFWCVSLKKMLDVSVLTLFGLAQRA